MMTPDPAFRTIHCIPDGRQAAAGFLQRPAMDLLDLLVSVDLLEREGDGEGAHYYNTPATAAFLDRNKLGYIGGILELWDKCNYGFQEAAHTTLRHHTPVLNI